MTEEAKIGSPLSMGIQPFGALIACDLTRDVITHVSQNGADVFAEPANGLLGAPLATVMPREFMHELRNIMSLRNFAEDRYFAGRFDMPMGARDVSVSQSTASGHVVVEFEAASDSQHSADEFSVELRHLSGALRAAGDDGKLLKAMAALMRFATGYDSALVYRFGPNGGEVIAETGTAAQRQFLGDRLKFLEDSPDAKYDCRRPILHFTVDVEQGTSPILSLEDASQGLDLSHCHLRGPTGAEAVALSSMGARSALTLPIVTNSGIWGMVLLLGPDPQTPSRYVRQLCDALAAVVCDRLEILAHSPAARPAILVSQAETKPDINGKSVIVVEDNRLIAADLKLTLLDLGFATVHVFTEEAPALAFLEKTKVDLGVLDVHLEGAATSFEVARHLAESSTPFLFASGFGATTDLPERFGPRPVVLKPATKRELSARIDELFEVGPDGPV